MQLSRIRGRKVNDYLRRNGRVWKGKTMTIRWLPHAPRHPDVDPAKPAIYVGTAASLQLDRSAVKRNRMRRRCREAFRIALRERTKLPTVQLLISPRPASLVCDFRDIEADVVAFLSNLS